MTTAVCSPLGSTRTRYARTNSSTGTRRGGPNSNFPSSSLKPQIVLEPEHKVSPHINLAAFFRPCGTPACCVPRAVCLFTVARHGHCRPRWSYNGRGSLRQVPRPVGAMFQNNCRVNPGIPPPAGSPLEVRTNGQQRENPAAFDVSAFRDSSAKNGGMSHSF